MSQHTAAAEQDLQCLWHGWMHRDASVGAQTLLTFTASNVLIWSCVAEVPSKDDEKEQEITRKEKSSRKLTKSKTHTSTSVGISEGIYLSNCV